MKDDAARCGRPRGFDREAALETAMHLFWRHGYEGASLAMLTGALGIAPPSLYAAFGSKADLYRACLDRYAQGRMLTLAADGQDGSLDAALASLFEQAITAISGLRGERGCMISGGLLHAHPDHHELAQELAARRGAMAARFEHALQAWLPPARSAQAARFLCAVLQGMAVQARDGADERDLAAVAAMARAAIVP